MILLRSALFNAYFILMTFMLTLPGTVLRFTAPHRMLWIGQMWGQAAVWGARVICGIRLEVTGREHLRDNTALLIASRHQSAFDTVVWLTLVPRCCYVFKHELIRIPLFGALVPLTGMIAVDRSGGAAALRHLMQEGERAVREKRQIVIFPEGTRAEPGALLPLQPGIAALAARTRLDVIPVLTDSGRCWSRRAFRKLPGTIHIRILPPISADLGRKALMQRLEATLGSSDSSPVDNSVGELSAGL